MRSFGSFFTWSNRHESGERIFSIIDWVFHNDLWLEGLAGVEVEFMGAGL